MVWEQSEKVQLLLNSRLTSAFLCVPPDYTNTIFFPALTLSHFFCSSLSDPLGFHGFPASKLVTHLFNQHFYMSTYYVQGLDLVLGTQTHSLLSQSLFSSESYVGIVHQKWSIKIWKQSAFKERPKNDLDRFLSAEVRIRWSFKHSSTAGIYSANNFHIISQGTSSATWQLGPWEGNGALSSSSLHSFLQSWWCMPGLHTATLFYRDALIHISPIN